MAYEIERKFLVNEGLLPPLGDGQYLLQGYICSEPERVVRVRMVGDDSFITIKGKTVGATRLEFEYPVPLADAQQLLAHLCQGPTIEKVRYTIRHHDHVWELDVFGGTNQGLIVAEVELASEDEALTLPDWITQEVTGDARYYNSNLLHHPYSQWGLSP